MSTEIPQTNPRAEYLACRREINAAIQRVLERGQYILGEEVRGFEKVFAAYLGTREVIGVASGTDALELALRACEIGPGDEVITVAHTAVATVAAIERTGARPVLVDVDPHFFTMDPEALPGALSKRTKAIVPVHLYGQIADMKAIGAFARAHGLRVVSDCAQCHGARTWPSGRMAGTLGDIAAFSFYPTKNLGALGDGGAVATADRALAERVRLLREYGWRERHVSALAGGNSRLDELQAAVLRVKLRHLDAWNEERARVAAIYDEALAGSCVEPPARAPYGSHVFHQYVVKLSQRDKVRAALASAAIKSAVHFPVPIHLQPAYRRLSEGARLTETERICSEILSLPIFPSLADDDARRVAKVIRENC